MGTSPVCEPIPSLNKRGRTPIAPTIGCGNNYANTNNFLIVAIGQLSQRILPPDPSPGKFGEAKMTSNFSCSGAKIPVPTYYS